MSAELSIIIPTFNRAPILGACLRALANQQLEVGRIEVLVVDDGSTDQTAEAVASARAESDLPIRYMRQSNAGANAARNRAIDAATGNLLLFINDDTIAAPEMVIEHYRMHAKHPSTSDAVLGALRIAPDLPRSIFNDLHHDHGLDTVAAGSDLGWRCFFTFNLSVKSELLRNPDRFDERLRWHEDIELGRRLARDRLRVLYAPDALAYHYHPIDESGWLAIAEREGHALATWWRKAPELKDELIPLGLHSRLLGTRHSRHVLADLALNRASLPLVTTLARNLDRIAPYLARAVWRKVFQYRKRRAIDAVLVTGTAPG